MFRDRVCFAGRRGIAPIEKNVNKSNENTFERYTASMTACMAVEKSTKYCVNVELKSGTTVLPDSCVERDCVVGGSLGDVHRAHFRVMQCTKTSSNDAFL